MAKIFRHRAMRSDEHVGHVDKDGKVYREKFGPDEYVGRVDYESGKVYAHRTGMDDYLGSVTAEGQIYGHQFGPDEYQASVNKENKIFANRSMAKDDYVGWVEDMTHMVEAAAGWFLFFADEPDEA